MLQRNQLPPGKAEASTGEAARPLIQPIGEAIDSAARHLRLWKQDRGVALYYLLTAFEDLVRLAIVEAVQARSLQALVDSDAERMNLENALTRLVAWAYQECQSAGARVPPVPFDWSIYQDARLALEFTCHYDAAVTAIESTLNRRQAISIKANRVSFSMLGDSAIDYEAVSRLAETFHTSRAAYPFAALALLLDPLRGPELISHMHSLVTQVDEARIAYTMTSRVEAHFHGLAGSAVRAPDLPPQTEVHGYSIAEFQRFFSSLYERAAVNQCFCWVSGQVGMGVGSLVLLLTRHDLEALAAHARLPGGDTTSAIISDLTYEPDLQHTDVFFQPFLAIAPDAFMISPMVITASNWERNLERLWSLKYGDEYSAKAGAAKYELAGAVCAALSRLGFEASANRRLSGPDGRLITDVDVAACDPRARVLLLAEVKWPIEPAEPREVRRADKELARGIEQVHAAAGYVHQDPDLASRQLFPEGRVHIGPDWCVHQAIIGRGHVGSACILAPEVPILDFHLTQAFLQSEGARGLDLAVLLRRLTAVLESPQPGTNYCVEAITFELAGYELSVPGYYLRSPLPFADVAAWPQGEIGRNAPCPCGSGRKYKHCHGRRSLR